jgi:hypothetical protein
MRSMFESLERRDHFSLAVPHTQVTGVPQNPAAVTFAAAATTLPNVVGSWNGTLTVIGIHDRPVTIAITREASNGRLSGTLTTSLDPSIVVAFSGRIKANGSMSGVSLQGIHSGGPINGAGTGKLNAAGNSMKFNLTFTQSGQGFPGTVTLNKRSSGTTTPPPSNSGSNTGFTTTSGESEGAEGPELPDASAVHHGTIIDD